jgi:DNA-binding NarL/FixJ family response regulator
MSADAASIRIVIVEDHPLYRRGLRTMIANVPQFTLAGEAADGLTAVETVLETRPDVGQGGIAAIREIIAAIPTVRILVITLYEDEDSVFAALRAGARGYILKDSDEEDMVRAIRAVAAGESLFSPTVASRLLASFAQVRPAASSPFPTLTERERDILFLMAQGRSNSAIADELFLSVKTVANNVSNIFGKLQVADRSEAIVRAREAGMGGERK